MSGTQKAEAAIKAARAATQAGYAVKNSAGAAELLGEDVVGRVVSFRPSRAFALAIVVGLTAATGVMVGAKVVAKA